MDIFNLLFGILLTILGILLYTLEKRYSKKARKDDYMSKSYKIEIYFGIFVFTICGIVTILRELF